MSSTSSIEWTDATWSPIRARVKEDAHRIAILHGWGDLAEIVLKTVGRLGPHCEFISTGCNHCYSCTNNHRCLPANGTGLPFDKRSRELVDIVIDAKILEQPLRWKKGKKIFVENQSDLFGEWVPFEFIDQVFAVMAQTPNHTYQILTKRAARMLAYCSDPATPVRISKILADKSARNGYAVQWPLPNVWNGISAENQPMADLRVPLLLQTPAAKRFVSYEPALSEVSLPAVCRSMKSPCWCGMHISTTDFSLAEKPKCPIDLVIVGGESGPGARPFDVKWARHMRQQSLEMHFAFFMKQFGAKPVWEHIVPGCSVRESIEPLRLKDRKGGTMEEWPEDLRVREFPK